MHRTQLRMACLAAAIAAFYRTLGGYPASLRGDLQGQLAEGQTAHVTVADGRLVIDGEPVQLAA